jgi:hypothetical protein
LATVVLEGVLKPVIIGHKFNRQTYCKGENIQINI